MKRLSQSTDGGEDLGDRIDKTTTLIMMGEIDIVRDLTHWGRACLGIGIQRLTLSGKKAPLYFSDHTSTRRFAH